MVKILSFDVSSVSTGWSFFKDDKLTAFGVIKIPIEYELQTRLLWFKYHIHMLLTMYKPKIVLVEDTYLKNVKTLKTLMQFIGVLNLMCGEILEVTPTFLSPNSIRSVFELKTKEDVFECVKDRYKVKLKELTFENGNDITDSILQGLYYIEKTKEAESNESKDSNAISD
jgi:Holliday junction resolvasome RuvABC endonuclease subunit